MTKPLDVSKYFTMLKPFETPNGGYYLLSSAVLRSQLELAFTEGVCTGRDERLAPDDGLPLEQQDGPK